MASLFEADYRKGHRWVTSSNDENWTCNRGHSTKELAIAVADEDHCYLGLATLVQNTDFSPQYSAEAFVERMSEQAYEIIGEAAEDFPAVSPDFIESELAPVFAMLIAKILAENPKRYRIDNVETFVPENYDPGTEPPTGPDRSQKLHRIHSRTAGELVQLADNPDEDPEIREMAKQETSRRRSMGITDHDLDDHES